MDQDSHVDHTSNENMIIQQQQQHLHHQCHYIPAITPGWKQILTVSEIMTSNSIKTNMSPYQSFLRPSVLSAAG